jgi:hypothetical protein
MPQGVTKNLTLNQKHSLWDGGWDGGLIGDPVFNTDQEAETAWKSTNSILEF